MRTPPVTAMLVFAIALFLFETSTRVRAAPQAPAAADATVSFDDAAGRTAQQKICSLCHDADLVVGLLRTPAEWNDLLELMSSYGAEMSNVQRPQILGFLLKNYGKVDANRALAAELAPVLDIPVEIADGLVRYRAAQGLFKTIDDLKAVPGLEPQKLQARKDRLTF